MKAITQIGNEAVEARVILAVGCNARAHAGQFIRIGAGADELVFAPDSVADGRGGGRAFGAELVSENGAAALNVADGRGKARRAFRQAVCSRHLSLIVDGRWMEDLIFIQGEQAVN